MLYLVDHSTACIYMEQVEGHSLKTLLHENSLADAGVCVCAALASSMCFLVPGQRSDPRAAQALLGRAHPLGWPAYTTYCLFLRPPL